MIMPTNKAIKVLTDIGMNTQEAISSLLCGYPYNIEELADLYGDSLELNKIHDMREFRNKVLAAG